MNIDQLKGVVLAKAGAMPWFCDKHYKVIVFFDDIHDDCPLCEALDSADDGWVFDSEDAEDDE